MKFDHLNNGLEIQSVQNEDSNLWFIWFLWWLEAIF